MTLRVVSPAGTRDAMIEEAVLRALTGYTLPFYIDKFRTVWSLREVLQHFLDCDRCLKYVLMVDVRRHFKVIRLN